MCVFVFGEGFTGDFRTPPFWPHADISNNLSEVLHDRFLTAGTEGVGQLKAA